MDIFIDPTIIVKYIYKGNIFYDKTLIDNVSIINNFLKNNNNINKINGIKLNKDFILTIIDDKSNDYNKILDLVNNEFYDKPLYISDIMEYINDIPKNIVDDNISINAINNIVCETESLKTFNKTFNKTFINELTELLSDHSDSDQNDHSENEINLNTCIDDDIQTITNI